MSTEKQPITLYSDSPPLWNVKSVIRDLPPALSFLKIELLFHYPVKKHCFAYLII